MDVPHSQKESPNLGGWCCNTPKTISTTPNRGEKKIAVQIKKYAATLHYMIHLDRATVEFLQNNIYKEDLTLALAYYHCCSINLHAAIFNDELGSDIKKSAMWRRILNLIVDPIKQKEAVVCQQTFRYMDWTYAKITACASCCECLFSLDCQEGIDGMCINALPSTFPLINMQIQWLTSLVHYIVKNQVQVVQHNGHFYHLNPDLVFGMNKIVLCPVCTKDPMTKDQESIAAGNNYNWLGYLSTPVWLYNIDLQIQANHSTNHSIAFPMTGPMECSKVLPCTDVDHRPQVTFLGPWDEWCKVAGK